MTTMASSRKESIKGYFSAKSGYWESLYDEALKKGFLHYELMQRKAIVFDLVSGIQHDKLDTVLDLGCGAGHYLVELAKMGLKCIGSDISEEMLALSRQKLDSLQEADASLVQADCSKLPMTDHSFDLVLSVGLLEYLDDEGEVLREIKRVLSPEGHAVVTLPNFYKLRNLLNPYYYLIRIWVYFFGNRGSQTGTTTPKQFDFRKSDVNRYSLSKAKRMIQSSGFKVCNVRSCCFGPFSFWKLTYHSRWETGAGVSRFFDWLLRYKLFGFLNYFSNSWVFLVKPSDQ